MAPSAGRVKLTLVLPPPATENGEAAVVLRPIIDACTVYPDPVGTQSVYSPFASLIAAPCTSPPDSASTTAPGTGAPWSLTTPVKDPYVAPIATVNGVSAP